MRKKSVVKRRHVSHVRKPKHFHHRVISFFKGDGGIYVIFILATVMAGAFALSGGILPSLSQNPTAADQVEIDEESAKQSSTSALQLVDIKIKPTATPTPTLAPVTTPTVSECFNKAAVAIVVDTSGSMHATDPGQTKTRIGRIKDALKTFKDLFQPDSALALIEFADSAKTLVPFGRFSQANAALNTAITNIVDDSSGATNMKAGLEAAITQLNAAKIAYPDYNQYTVFMSDGAPESGDCKYRQYSGSDGYDNGPYNWYRSGDPKTTGIVPPFCTLPETGEQPTFFTHLWSPIVPGRVIKNTGKLFALSMRSEPNPNDPDYTYDRDIFNKTGSLMQSLASDPDTTFFISSPTTANLTAAYQKIAANICPTP